MRRHREGSVSMRTGRSLPLGPDARQRPGFWYGTQRSACVGGVSSDDHGRATVTTVATADDEIRKQLAELGLAGGGAVHRNLPPAELIARSLARGEGILAANGALVRQDRRALGPLARGPRHRRGRARRRPGLLGRHQHALHAGALRPPARQGARLPARPRPLRLRRLRRRRAHLPPAQSASSPTRPGTRCSPTRSSCAPPRSSSRTSTPASR